MVHLSVRVAWHDTGWNGRICKAPHLNASCIVQENIRDERDDDKERQSADIPVADLKSWLPPCSRDIGAYSPTGYSLTHADPLHRGFLKPTTENVPPYSVLPAPYRWVREENQRDLAETEGLRIPGPTNPKKVVGWVYEPDRQKTLLDYFWGKIKEGEGQALIFYYANQGNPVDENAARLIVGVGRVAKVGTPVYFSGTDQDGNTYPIWTRAVTQDYPKQGFRLPYQEYIQQGLDPRSIACHVPQNALLPFSYIGEHVSDDVAVSVLERLIQCVQTIKDQGQVQGPWDKQLHWLDTCLNEVWRGRGPFPGIGSVLQYLDMARGVAFQRLVLRNFVREGKNPWEYVRKILDKKENPPRDYAADFIKAQRKWEKVGFRPERLKLLDALVRFEITPEQVRRVCDPDERSAAGILAKETELIANPYLICENDLGADKSVPVALDTIDRGMLPEGDAALFIAPEAIVATDDDSRVRAVAVDVLREAAKAGDTVLTLDDLLKRIRERFPDRRACRPDRDLFTGAGGFHGAQLWLALDQEPPIVGLQYLHDLEIAFAETIRSRVKRFNQAPKESVEWKAALIKEFGKPESERDKAAIAEKITALETLFSQRVSTLTGSAGTGKTSVLKVFLDTLEQVDGQTGIYLLAPTGKARVRLATKTHRKAYTIHQFLLRQNWFRPNLLVLKREGGKTDSAPTVIIDEASMVPMDLLGTLFKALETDMIKRLVFVGDPNQLPPIGPGRPFVDLVEWLQEKHPKCVATLHITMRVDEVASAKASAKPRPSVALALADGYRTDVANPSDDELLSLVARGEYQGQTAEEKDLEVHFWKDHDELKRLLKERMQALLGIGKDGDYASFNRSLGIADKPYEQKEWKKAEAWQILSPLRSHPFGTDELNRSVQMTYHLGLIRTCQQPWSKMQKPFGDQEMVYTDKVIQVVNHGHQAWPRDAGGLDYVANGEIGIITRTDKYNESDYLQVGFATQDGVTYRYYRSEVNENLELAYALTVHKAQGSDFDYVFLIIPQEAQTLSRELLYTGLTRFRKKLVLLVERDTTVLQSLRQPKRSDTYQRNTNLFSLCLRPDLPGVPYPQGLIHRTAGGVMVRSKSEVIVAGCLDRLKLTWKYEEPLLNPKEKQDFRLPDFTVAYQGDYYYWEHLGLLNLPGYEAAWKRKCKWYEARGIPIVGDGAPSEKKVKPGSSPIVITSRDSDNGGIDEEHILELARRYILLED